MGQDARIVAGDIGATKTVLVLQEDGCRLREEVFASAEFSGLEAILDRFLGDASVRLSAAAFGVPGPVWDGVARATNLPWKISQDDLSAALGGAPVRLVNDMEATAVGVVSLPEAELEVLNAGESKAATRALLAVGTGLGQAILLWHGGGYVPLATEGGHAGLAPRSERQIALLRFLARRFGRVSIERAVSGSGLPNLFEFVTQVEGVAADAAVRERLGNGDDSATIGAAGLAGSCPASVSTLDLFCELLAAHCCDLALSAMALGGIYLAGGVVPKLLPILRRPSFVQSYAEAGRFSELVRDIPVWAVLEPRAALSGALAMAQNVAPQRK